MNAIEMFFMRNFLYVAFVWEIHGDLNRAAIMVDLCGKLTINVDEDGSIEDALKKS